MFSKDIVKQHISQAIVKVYIAPIALILNLFIILIEYKYSYDNSQLVNTFEFIQCSEE